ncbi:cytochrome c biogenesis protein DipZ [Sphingomonas sp. NSE70-1]|uniref:Cytochrome c biogenesis protein DipZ n=1 Tax=Sphingomonas caseinilyticus TaxID=2908205 RepID=A0ABT0RQU1_9SPHN|nr:cytochrome c biogenesis protein DipZ [Sphingomonas caseinilyticus]MCL6697216.1 cytochrome c biogenesis protein DipZ [Sphingomonas caseinilyticus]
MLLFLLAYLGGILTILSPCILPVLPFVFARADRPFLRNGLPLLAGMALTFAGVATLAAVGGELAITANNVGRWIALVLLAAFALLLVFPALADRAMRPLVGLGERLSSKGSEDRIGGSLLLGVATGLLWAPCAGPILGIILTGAALSGTSSTTTGLLLAYSLGAATSLALALLVGGKVFAAMKRSIGAGEGVRRLLGVLILIGVGTIALGLDTRVLARLSTAQTFAFEHRLARALGMEGEELTTRTGGTLPVEGVLPPLDGAITWLNSPPLTREQLKGKVVLIDFWTYSCINCIRSVPYVRAWAEQYRKDGLVVIGVHSPEFAFEKDPANVRKAIADFGIRYPVAVDSNLAIWRAFDNRYWPAHYLADAQGRIRYHHFGEGSTDQTEAAIRSLLAENGAMRLAAKAKVDLKGASAAADFASIRSRETWLGTRRARNFASPEGLRDGEHRYRLPDFYQLNFWGFEGRWNVEEERSVLLQPGGKIAYEFRARDLHLVLGSASGRPIRFQVLIDGKAPGNDRGMDIDAAGNGQITGQRLYQLVRQQDPSRERLFTITFLDPGAEAYAFTFG